MRKRIINQRTPDVTAPNQQWLNLERLAQVEVTSEDPALSIESALIQRMPTLVAKMLGHLETKLRPEIDEVASIAGRSLVEELLRIERYYTAMLDDIGGRGTDIPDEGSRQAIQSEHSRRAKEERERHAVRAVVHPVQLAEWEMLVQRAAWKLDGADGHSASFTAQRPLAA